VTFVNEYIPEADVEKYKLKEIDLNSTASGGIIHSRVLKRKNEKA
jgi:hypothetical protein